eukprot:2606650-Prymnesium_polylepis.3
MPSRTCRRNEFAHGALMASGCPPPHHARERANCAQGRAVRVSIASHRKGGRCQTFELPRRRAAAPMASSWPRNVRRCACPSSCDRWREALLRSARLGAARAASVACTRWLRGSAGWSVRCFAVAGSNGSNGHHTSMYTMNPWSYSAACQSHAVLFTTAGALRCIMTPPSR